VIAPHLRNPHLTDRLREFSGQTLIFHPAPGSAGDSLRHAATYQLFRDLDIRFRLLSETEDIAGAVVVIGGGGNLIPAYSSVRKALIQTAKAASRVIVLPQSVRGNEDLLEELGESVEIFCRDPGSYLHVLTHRSRARAQLAHDLSFSIDVDRLRSSAAAQADALLAEKAPTRPLQRLMAESGHQFFFQKSRKRTKRFCPKSSIDISLLFKTGTKPDEAEVGALALLSYLDRVHEIHTDRLHVGIAGAMLGKRVYLYDDSYGIVGGSYRHSLHADFPKVQLIP
jgi:exopolysaccharide biosynthesis predicted pyruvyltransferase EpsI